MVTALKHDPIRKFLCDIGRDKLLTADQEVELSRQIQILRDVEAIQKQAEKQKRVPFTDLEIVEQLGLTMPEYRQKTAIAKHAKQKMVQHNLRLVVNIAKRYQKRGLDLEDLISEGTVGLIRGVEKFDHTKGYKLSTYITWWIRQAITRSISEKSRTIRLPIHITEKLNTVKRVSREFFAANGRQPKPDELPGLTGFSPEMLQELAGYYRRTGSLDRKIGPNEDTHLIDLLGDEDENGMERIEKISVTEGVHSLLNCLDETQRTIISLRWGLNNGGQKMTLDDVSDTIGLSRERVRQIQVRALKRLRSHAKRNGLDSLLD